MVSNRGRAATLRPMPGILQRLFPPALSNAYRGHPAALWALAPLAALTLWRSCVHIFRADGGAQSIATIPLHTFTAAGADAVVLVFALWGLQQLLLAAFYVLALWRYRALTPFLYLLFVAEYAGRFAISQWKAVETAQTPPGAIGNMVFPVLGAVLLALSLWPYKREGPS